MTIYLTEQQLRDITWAHEHSETLNVNVEPRGREDEYGDAEPAVSEAYGFSELRGAAPDGTELTLMLDWASSGDTSGTLNDLYDWERPQLGTGNPAYPAELSEDVVLLDDDGDECDEHELADLLADIADDISEQWQPHAHTMLPAAPAPEDIDVDEEDDMGTHTIERDNEPALRFTGELIAEASSWRADRDDRWTELRLYRTRGGRYICEQVGHTRWQGERTRHSAGVCDTEADVIDWLGHGWLAKELYAEAGIDAAVDVD